MEARASNGVAVCGKVVESLKGRGVKLHLLDLGGDIAGNGISKLSGHGRRVRP